MILVDTNVWSEATKASPSAVVRAWADEHEDQLWLSAVVLAELRAGASQMSAGKRRSALEAQFDSLSATYSGRTVSFDSGTASHYAAVLENARRVGRPIQTADAMIAATALQHGMAVATRDLGDFAGAGVKLINPWLA